jgi:predicted RNA-binding Zn ribbon-like protein
MTGVIEARNVIPPLVGGHVVLDLINTVEPRAAVADRLERLATPADLLDWAHRAQVVDAAEADAVRAAWAASATAGRQALGAAIEIREAAYALLGPRAYRHKPETLDTCGALESLALRRAAAAARSELVRRDDGPAVRVVVGTTPAMLIPDRLAHAAVDLLSTADLSTLRACPLDEGGCGWLFFDRSRNGSRRWCVMADCGTNAKARRLTERRRAKRQVVAGEGT